MLYDPEMLANGGCVEMLDPLPTRAAEQRLLAAVAQLYERGVLPSALEHVSLGQAYGCAPEHADVALYAVWHYFRSRQRWAAAAACFGGVARCHPSAVVWQAAALRASGRGEGITQLLGTALERDPDSPTLLVAMATECMALQQVSHLGCGVVAAGLRDLRRACAGLNRRIPFGAASAAPSAAGAIIRSPTWQSCHLTHTWLPQVDTASRLARRAVQFQRRCRPAWLLLARCYAAEGLYAEALATLNAVPTPPLPRDERELLFVVPPPPTKHITEPTVRWKFWTCPVDSGYSSSCWLCQHTKGGSAVPSASAYSPSRPCCCVQVRHYDPDLEAARGLALEEGDTGGLSRMLAYLPGAGAPWVVWPNKREGRRAQCLENQPCNCPCQDVAVWLSCLDWGGQAHMAPAHDNPHPLQSC